MSSFGIKVHFGALKTTSWWEHLLRFFFGGAITVIAGLLAKKYGPAFGGLFLAFPAIFPASATLLERHEKKEKEERGVNPGHRGRDAAAIEARGSALGTIGLLLFAVFTWLLLPNHTGWLIIPCAAVLWMASAFALWLLRKYRHRL